MSVACLNETWLRTETNSKVDIASYNFISKYRQGRKGGGIGILVSKELNYRIPDIQLPESKEVETMVVELKCKQDSLLIVNMYRPPNTNLMESLKTIKAILEMIRKFGKPTVLCTDHNMNLLQAASHKKTQAFLETCIEMGLYPCITKPT